ncbi:MAG TPA: helix-turn-helix domain-containing protein [Mucilaginibacter sp.]|jgi:transcriptional regulator GlxA family with amidase domain
MIKHISVMVPEGNPQLVCIIGCYKAFIKVNQYLVEKGNNPMFAVQLVGNTGAMSLDQGVFTVKPHIKPADLKKTDLIIIPAMSWDFDTVIKVNGDLLPWITAQYKRGAEVASVCTGGFLLAATGLLKGRQCATHWLAAGAFRRMFPDVNLMAEKLITDEFGIYTNGGAFSFLHLLLYLIEKYCGRETAIYCSKFFEIDIDRTSQSAFTMFSGLKDHHDEEIKKAQLFIEANIDKKMSIEELADKFGIGRRNFDRRFIKATYHTPGEYMQKVKIEAAKKALELSRRTISEVMYEVGYSDSKAFRDVFKKCSGLSPLEYRNKYNKEAVLLQ